MRDIPIYRTKSSWNNVDVNHKIDYYRILSSEKAQVEIICRMDKDTFNSRCTACEANVSTIYLIEI